MAYRTSKPKETPPPPPMRLARPRLPHLLVLALFATSTVLAYLEGLWFSTACNALITLFWNGIAYHDMKVRGMRLSQILYYRIWCLRRYDQGGCGAHWPKSKKSMKKCPRCGGEVACVPIRS